MPCIPALPITCLPAAGDAAASGLTGALGNSFAEAMRDGAAWVIRMTIGWWIEVPAIDLETSPAPTIRGYVHWLALVVVTAALIWQGIVMAVSRRPEPLFAVGRGLFYVALWSAIGIIGPAAALEAGDSFSSWVLDEAAGGQASERLVRLAGLSQITSPGAVIVLGLCMILAGLAQAVLMMFREAAVVVLAGVVVLAAAGSLTQGTRPWLPRVLGWLLALIAYKPAAALVYATALTLVGEGDDPRTVMVGLAMMILAIVALPVLTKFFTWTTGASSGSGGGLAALAGASAAAIHASAAFSGPPAYGPSAQAGHIRADLGPVTGMPSGAAPAPPSPGAPPNAASAAGSATGTGAGAAAQAGAATAAGGARAAGRAMTNDEGER